MLILLNLNQKNRSAIVILYFQAGFLPLYSIDRIFNSFILKLGANLSQKSLLLKRFYNLNYYLKKRLQAEAIELSNKPRLKLIYLKLKINFQYFN